MEDHLTHAIFPENPIRIPLIVLLWRLREFMVSLL